MAKRLNYTIGVDADTSKFEASLQKAITDLNKLNSINLSTGLNEANKAAISLAGNLRRAINQETGKLDLTNFNNNLKQSGETLNSYYQKLAQLGPAGEQAFLSVARSVTEAELPLKRSSKLLNELWITMKNTMRWQLTSSALHSFVGSLEEAYGYAKSLDSSLNNIRIVSEKSADDMARFAEQANKAAKALSTTTTNYTDASLIYYQQGLTDQEVLDRTETTIKMANVAGTTAETASQQLTAIWNNFYDGSQSLEHYADVMVKLGAATASSSDEISEGIEKFAAVANTVGLSYEYAASALATVTAQTRESASVVGTAFRTLFSRIQGLQQGETLDDGTTLNKYSTALLKVGVDIKDTNGDLKDMDEILDDLGGKWDGLAQDQKIALAETVAGVRQWTQLIALMDNWDFFKENLAMAQNADGALEQQADIYAESWEAARDRVKASTEDVYDSLINKDFFISFDNGLSKILDRTADFVDGMGGLAGVLATLSKLTLTVYGDKIEANIRDMVQNIGLMTGYEQIRSRELQAQAAILAKEATVGNDDLFESQRMDIMQTEVDYQIKLNAELDKMSDAEKQVVQGIQDAIKLRKEEYEAAVNVAKVTKNQIEESSANLSISGRLRTDFASSADKKAAMSQLVSLSGVKTRLRDNAGQLMGSKSDIEVGYEALDKLIAKYKEAATAQANFNLVRTRNNSTFKNDTEQIEKYARSLGMTEEQIQKIVSAPRIEKALSEGIDEATQKTEELRNVLAEMFGLSPQSIDTLGRLMQKLALQTSAATTRGNEFKSSLTGGLAVIQQVSIQIKDLASKMVTFASVASSVAMMTTAFNSLVDTFSDDSLSNVERFTRLLSSLSLIVPNLIDLMGKFGKIKLFDKWAEQMAINIEVLGFWKRATLGQAAAEGTLSAAEATQITLLLAKVAVIAAIVAAIALLTAGIYLLVKAYNADADAAKEAAAGVETLTKNYEEAKNAASELKETINNWDEAVKSLDDLKQGTDEYKEALKKANDQAKELIETYGLYNDFYTENGVIKFKDGALDRIQEEADIRESQAENALYTGKILSNNANLKSERTNATRDTGITEYYLDQALELQKSSQENPISDEEFANRLKDLVPYLNSTITDVKDIRTSLQALADATDEATEANEYYAKNILGSDIKENRGDFLNGLAGDDEGLKQQLVDAYAASENQYLEEQDKALSNLTVAASNYGSNNALGNYIGQYIDGDEELARLYASMVLGRDDVDDLSYKGGWNKGSLQTGSGEEIFNDMSDDYMRKAIAQAYAQQELLKQLAEGSDGFDQEAYEDSLTKLVEGTKALGDAFGDADFTSAILNSMAQGEGKIDLSTLFTQLSPDDVAKLVDDSSRDEIIKSLGLTDEDFAQLGFTDADAWWNSFQTSLKNYDPTTYWQALSESSKKNAEDIGGILASYQNDEDLSDEQIAILDKLGESYSNLNKLREEGGHEYLQILREIQEQEEENNVTALRNLQQEQQEKADALQQEIADLKEKKENTTNSRNAARLQVQIEAKTEEFDKVIDDILDTNYQIDIAVNADLKSDVDQAFGLADELEKIQGYLSDGLEISFDRAQEIIEAGYGAMLTNAQETADNTIKLNRDVVNGFIDGKQSEIEADRQSKIAQLESERALLVTKQQSLQAGIDALNTGLDATDNTAKAEALIQASKYKAQADAAQITAEQEADAADQSNDEIATDAENLVNALGIMHDTNAENSQQAYKDAETAANDSARSQINALNQIQKAAVAYSNAVRDAANGTATYNPVTFSGSSNVSVGATGSKSANNTYETTEANIDISTEDILEAANNNSEVLDQALEKAKAELEAQKASVDAQIGAVDGGIAALKSATASLDKAQSGLGKSSGSGGSKSKTYDKEDLKTLKDVEDRYHKINREIQRQDDLLDDLSNTTDRAWGTDALNGYENEIKALEKQQELYNQKLTEAQGYLVQDSALVKQYFADAQIGADGEITNYEDLLRENLNLYNAAVERYNLAVSGKELSEEEHTALKNQLDAEKEKFDLRQKALEQYEDTLDVIRDTTDNIQETARSIADKKLEEIKFKMEVVLDVKSMKDAVRDLSKEIAEMFGDALTHGLKSAALSAESAQAEAALLPSYQEEWDSLKELYESTTDEADRRAIMDEIQNLQGNIVDSAKAIAEWANSIEDIVPDAVDAASERFAAFTDQLEHNTSVLDTIKELYTLQGVTYKTAEGFNRLQKNSQEKLNAQLASAKLQRGWYEQAAQRLEEAQAKLDSLGGDETDLRYDAYKKARDAYLEEFNEAQEAYLSSAQEAMETAQDMYLQQIEKAVYEFGQAVSNGVGLDLLQDKYDHYIEQNERYFDKVNEAYQVSAWYNKLQQDIDDTTNSAHKERLKALQEEINQRREGNKLSQYDLDILNAKYQVLQAQMALEDAQNAKNQIQLVRDSQGNWNYQYTANQDDIANAQQNLLDAENDWYNIAKQQVTDVTGEIVSTWQECQDKIKDIYSDMTLTDEERSAQAQEIYQYYSEKIKYLEEEKQNAISDMTEAGNKNLIDNAIITGDTITDLTGITSEELQQLVADSGESIADILMKNSEQLKEIAGDNTDLIDKFNNTYAKDLDDMTQNTTNFEDELRKLLDQAQQDFDNYKDKVQNVADETGTTLDDLAQETDKVSEATDQLRERGDEAKDTLWDMIDAARNASSDYLDLAQSIWGTVEALQALASAQASYASSKSGMSGSSKSYDKNTDYAAMIEQGLINGWIDYGDDTFNRLLNQRGDKITGEGMDYTNEKEQFSGYHKGDSAQGWAKGQYDTEEEWQAQLDKLKKEYGLATGGYTGLFDDAKLAFLHQKELVLNQSDTENILAAVQAVRTIGTDLFKSIEKSLDGNAIAAMALMGQKLNPVATTPVQDSIEQTVHIDKVEFPNVTSRTEIEEAFISLTNDAAQWARRKT